MRHIQIRTDGSVDEVDACLLRVEHHLVVEGADQEAVVVLVLQLTLYLLLQLEEDLRAAVADQETLDTLQRHLSVGTAHVR